MLLNLKKAGYSDYGQAQYIAYRTLFVVQSLLLLGGRRVASRIAMKAIKNCHTYHLTSVELELVQLLRIDASLKANFAEFDRLTARISTLMHDLQAETVALGYYGELTMHLGKRLKDAKELATQANEYSNRLRELDSTSNSFTFRTNYFRVQHYSLTLSGRFSEVIELCDSAIGYYSSMPQFAKSVVVSEFAYRKLDACLKSRDFQHGAEAAATSISLLKEGSNNWFTIQYLYSLLLLHTIRFEQAYDLVNTVLNHDRFASMPPILQENWKIVELHVLYAMDLLQHEGGKVTKVKPENRLEALLQVAPTVAQDKQGSKVSLLILHILYLLEIGDFNGIIDRMEALRLYRARYLKAAQFPKTASFFKLLQIMENNSFSYKLVKEKGEKEYEKLIASTENQEEINEGLQILPYDWLWLKILDRLKEYEEKFAKRGF